ncbi:MAG: hypothetical protein EOM25_01835 [Deltaproteobacteria bacterium]|nr:hypothetical protein [Deltaproteobacteria bacterium]
MNPKKIDALQLTLAICLPLGFGIILRLFEAPHWDNPSLWVDGEPLMATHDAYAWLAGAEGAGRLTGQPLSLLLKYLAMFTGIDTGVLFFWLPALVAPLVAVPVVLICRFFGAVEAGIPAGVLAASGFGFLARTRIGYGDTDILTLFLPFMLVAALIWWLESGIDDRWRIRFAPLSHDALASRSTGVFRALSAGLVWNFYLWFYPSAYPITVTVFAIAVAVALWQWQASPRTTLAFQAGIVVALGLLGWKGILLAIAGILAEPHLRARRIRHWVAIFLALVLALILYQRGLNAIWGIVSPVLGYLKPEAALETANASFQLPGVVQSIREAQNVSITELGSRLAWLFIYFAAGLCGLAVVCLRRPLALTLLPFIGLALASVKLGNRFTMYGPPVLGIGLGLGLALLLPRILPKPARARWLVQIILAVALAWPAVQLSRQFRPGPILPNVFAQTLLDLRENSSEDAQLWQWWDYGYAAQYYSQRRSFGDGGDHEGPHLYPLAVAHATAAPLQAAQTILLVAATQQEQWAEWSAQGKTPTNPEGTIPYYPTDPVLPLRGMTGSEAAEFMASLATKRQTWPHDLPDQLLVLSWENLRLAYWICTFGNWDLATEKSRGGGIQALTGQAKFDTKQGLVILPQGTVELKTMRAIDDKGLRETAWKRSKGFHLLINNLSREAFLMDDLVHDSMLVQMLLTDPESFSSEFELVLDRFPWNRVYRVRSESFPGRHESANE